MFIYNEHNEHCKCPFCSSPSQKDSPPAAKKTKKAATKKPTKVPETQANGKEAETNDEETQVAGGEEPPGLQGPGCELHKFRQQAFHWSGG